MKILNITPLTITDIIVIRFARFMDNRGFFTEPFRKSDLLDNSRIQSLKKVQFVQSNESYSHKGTIRGLHFQWNPYMGKMVRTVSGHMVDIVLDIRRGSPTFGKAIAYDMPDTTSNDYSEWIWIPPGFAHGNFFPQESRIEYFCSGEYSQGCEAGISPLAKDIDWSLCSPDIKKEFDRLAHSPNLLISEKDRAAQSLQEWLEKEESHNFLYNELSRD